VGRVQLGESARRVGGVGAQDHLAQRREGGVDDLRAGVWLHLQHQVRRSRRGRAGRRESGRIRPALAAA
jgi:hypothetical protein